MESSGLGSRALVLSMFWNYSKTYATCETCTVDLIGSFPISPNSNFLLS